MSLFFKKKNSLTFTDGSDLEPRWRKVFRFFGEIIQVAALVTAIVVPIRYFLVQPFYVKGASMEPNFFDKEYLVIDELTYRFRDPVRGEITVFRYPNDPSQFFIKRIIGLPGDTVTVSGGKVLVKSPNAASAVVLDEKDYLDPMIFTAGEKAVTLGLDDYFLMGDNRGASMDSRIFGAVPRKNIIGRVMLRGLPLNRVTWYETPEYKF